MYAIALHAPPTEEETDGGGEGRAGHRGRFLLNCPQTIDPNPSMDRHGYEEAEQAADALPERFE